MRRSVLDFRSSQSEHPWPQAEIPAALAAPGETAVATWHAEGAQVYECKAGGDGKLAWAFREPIATLLARRQDRRPALCRPELGAHGRQHGDWQGCRAMRPARRRRIFPGSSSSRGEQGQRRLSGVTTVQRINTVGGRHEGACEKAGTLLQRALCGRLRVPEKVTHLGLAASSSSVTISPRSLTRSAPSRGDHLLHARRDARLTRHQCVKVVRLEHQQVGPGQRACGRGAARAAQHRDLAEEMPAPSRTVASFSAISTSPAAMKYIECADPRAA